MNSPNRVHQRKRLHDDLEVVPLQLCQNQCRSTKRVKGTLRRRNREQQANRRNLVDDNLHDTINSEPLMSEPLTAKAGFSLFRVASWRHALLPALAAARQPSAIGLSALTPHGPHAHPLWGPRGPHWPRTERSWPGPSASGSSFLWPTSAPWAARRHRAH